jgi:hypothetical protein
METDNWPENGDCTIIWIFNDAVLTAEFMETGNWSENDDCMIIFKFNDVILTAEVNRSECWPECGDCIDFNDAISNGEVRQRVMR